MKNSLVRFSSTIMAVLMVFIVGLLPAGVYAAPDKEAVASRQVTVGGTVADENGEPVPGVSVSVKGTARGAVTDVDGKYSISDVPDDAILMFSFIGMGTKEVPIDGQREINVILETEAGGLEEVVVVGYGTQKKINLTGAVSMIKGDVFENRPIVSVSSGLQGMLPGVTVTSSSGQPGAVPDIKIRGRSTIHSSTSPLILIDGVAGGDLNLLNLSDIESISVLKDAASAAIYGARAANGVLLITTKKRV